QRGCARRGFLGEQVEVVARRLGSLREEDRLRRLRVLGLFHPGREGCGEQEEEDHPAPRTTGGKAEHIFGWSALVELRGIIPRLASSSWRAHKDPDPRFARRSRRPR